MKFCRTAGHGAWTAGLLIALTVSPCAAQDAGENQPSLVRTIEQGLAFLRSNQAADGSYSRQVGPGITALATAAMLRNGRPVDDPRVARSLEYLEGFVQGDGSISTERPGTTNYDTCICLMCFALANKDGRYRKVISDAQQFLKTAQHDEGEDRGPDDTDYGGLGYVMRSAGCDLSNTHMMLEALEAAGDGPDDPAVQRAIVFVSRCQNLESEYNTLKFAAQINDGGFYYSPLGEGGSAAGKDDRGALRSYGSMTYAGLKSMVYAGLTADDPRVKAATQWLHANYTVEENPGLGTAGLYYYYHLMAKALDALGSPVFADGAGVDHDWRRELTVALAARQKDSGAWINENNRWYESDPNLSTSFALLALSYCRPAE